MTMEELLVRIGERLYKKRKELGVTQEKMAEQLEMSASYYRDVERGRKHISIENILLVYERTGMDPDYLLAGEELKDKAVMEIFKNCPEEKQPALEQVLADLAEILRQPDLK